MLRFLAPSATTCWVGVLANSAGALEEVRQAVWVSGSVRVRTALGGV